MHDFVYGMDKLKRYSWFFGIIGFILGVSLCAFTIYSNWPDKVPVINQDVKPGDDIVYRTPSSPGLVSAELICKEGIQIGDFHDALAESVRHVTFQLGASILEYAWAGKDNSSRFVILDGAVVIINEEVFKCLSDRLS